MVILRKKYYESFFGDIDMNGKYYPVSTIIPCYCCADTIGRAVKSVWTQSWRPYEVFLVDDASPDNTLDVLYALKRQYPENWIKVISLKTNKGPGYARNVGWEQASQEYIAFLDADDSWHPQKVEIQLKWMLKNPNVVLSGHLCKQLNGYLNDELPYNNNTMVFNEELFDKFNIKFVSKRSLLLSNQFSTRTVMLKKDIPFRFYEKRYSEDYLLWLMIVLNDYKAALIELPLAYLYKAPYGEGGLSGQLWEMEKGELETYLIVSKEKPILRKYIWLLYIYSMIKFIKRLLLSMFIRGKKVNVKD